MKDDRSARVTTVGDREIRMTRTFDAPRERVFDAWTRPELLKRWYGPRGWSLVVCEIDLRVGGAFRFVTRKPDGREVGQRGTYREVLRPERIVHTESWDDWDPGEVLVTVAFDDGGATTTLTSTMRFPSQQVRDELLRSGLADGFGESCGELDALLTTLGDGGAGELDLVVTRTFEAAPEDVWRAWSEPAAVMKWWGPTGFTCPRADMDFREGGTSLVCMRAPDALGGREMYNTWSYERLVPHERIELVLRFTDEHGVAFDPAQLGLEGVPESVPHVITITAKGDRATELTVIERGYRSRDALELSERGLVQCLDKMAAALASP